MSDEDFSLHTRNIYEIPEDIQGDAVTFIEQWLHMLLEAKNIAGYSINFKRHKLLWRIRYISLEASVRPGNGRALVDVFVDNFMQHFSWHIVRRGTEFSEKELRFLRKIGVNPEDAVKDFEDDYEDECD